MRDYFLRLAIASFALGVGGGCLDDERTTSPTPRDVVTTAAPCVYFKDLAPFLPESLEGFTVGATAGSTGKYGEVSVSEAERTYTRGEGREVKVRIVDTTMGLKLGQAIREAAQKAKGRAASDPTAPIQWKEAVGFVRYDADESVAEANLLVGERFVVAVTSRGFPSTVEVRRVARGIDLAGLARLQ
ncbi:MULTISPECIES: hypothetical protein [unclassified Corallococcus]|uniref:hypothetical protein n=1 Tax=unclassified Corallococcus TaxID=2685029 RepID=UPI0022A94374|nr:hypothetical protein [Corallococcus sp. NCRR]WAS88888.1 hypothetical protein O0N60_18355 [Corallococcus sp. NCRR]